MRLKLAGLIYLAVALAVVLAASMAWVQIGCRDSAVYQTSLSLADQLELAEVESETPFIDLGTDQARAALGRGWSWNEISGETSFVWGVDTESCLSFFSSQARALELRFRCLPFDGPDALPQEITISINDTDLSPLQLEPGMREYSVDLPESAILAGQNRLCFRYANNRSPLETDGSGDRRQLAVAWDWIGIDLEAPAAVPNTEGDALLLAAGSQIDFFFLARAGDRLAIDQIENPNDSAVSVDVSYFDDTAGEIALFSVERHESHRSVELPTGESTKGKRPIRLRFRGVAQGGRNQTTQPLELRGARVETQENPGSVLLRQGDSDDPDRGTRYPNIVIYLVDTLRADRLGVYGNSKRLTPELDKFATEAIVFEHAFAHSSWTKPSVASIFTGLLPDQHGVNHRRHRLSDSITTLAESLRIAGYATVGFATNPYLAAGSGLHQGFDTFDLSEDRSDLVNQRVLSWLRHRDTRSPFLLYVHTVEPHDPYVPPEKYREEFAPLVDEAVGSAEHLRALSQRPEVRNDAVVADLEALYDAEVAFSDQQFGLLITELRNQGQYENSLIFFVSDHGEAFYEHGVLGHGWDLYREVVEVPLIVRPPGPPRPQTVREPVQLIDLVPTVLDLVGLEPTPGLSGVSLLFRSKETGQSGFSSDDRPVFSYMDYEGRRGMSVVFGQWKLIEPLSSSFMPRRALFDRANDPLEERNLVDRYPALSGWLAALSRRRLISLENLEPAQIMEFDEKTERRLRALGYIE